MPTILGIEHLPEERLHKRAYLIRTVQVPEEVSDWVQPSTWSIRFTATTCSSWSPTLVKPMNVLSRERSVIRIGEWCPTLQSFHVVSLLLCHPLHIVRVLIVSIDSIPQLCRQRTNGLGRLDTSVVVSVDRLMLNLRHGNIVLPLLPHSWTPTRRHYLLHSLIWIERLIVALVHTSKTHIVKYTGTLSQGSSKGEIVRRS